MNSLEGSLHSKYIAVTPKKETMNLGTEQYNLKLIRKNYLRRLLCYVITGTIIYYCRTDIDEAKVLSALQHKSKYKPKINLDLF